MKTERYEKYVWPLLEKIEANEAHERAIDWLEWVQRLPLGTAIIEKLLTGGRVESERLKVRLSGMELDNPLILAAGFDKDGRVVEAMHALGFASVVVGTVMEWPQFGHPQPSMFRPEKGVLLNRLGFPSLGLYNVKEHLRKLAGRQFPLGVSVAASANPRMVKELERYADYVVINASSPNTLGLWDYQSEDRLREVVGRLKGKLPTWVKVSPDLGWAELDGVIRVVVDEGLAGIVATNTTTDKEVKRRLGERWATEPGGVSGTPLSRRSNEVIRYIYQEAGGCVQIMGAGGVNDLDSLLAKFRAGASAVKLLTGLVYKGPGLPNELNQQLDDWMEKYGVGSVAELVGESCL